MIHITASTFYSKLGELIGTPKKMTLIFSGINQGRTQCSIDFQLKQLDKVIFERSLGLQPMTEFTETEILSDLSNVNYEGGVSVNLYWKVSNTSIVAAWYPNNEVVL